MPNQVLPLSSKSNLTFAVTTDIESTETHFAIQNIGTVSNLKIHVHANDTTSYSYDELNIDFASEDSVLFFNEGTAESPIFKNNQGQEVSMDSVSFINLKAMSASIFHNSLATLSDKITGSIGAHIASSAYTSMTDSQIANINFAQSNESLISGWDEAKRTNITNEVQSLIQERIDTSGDASEKIFWQDKVFGGTDLTGQSSEYSFGTNEVLWILIESPFLMETLFSLNHSAFAPHTRVQDSTRFLVGIVNNPQTIPDTHTIDVRALSLHPNGFVPRLILSEIEVESVRTGQLKIITNINDYDDGRIVLNDGVLGSDKYSGKDKTEFSFGVDSSFDASGFIVRFIPYITFLTDIQDNTNNIYDDGYSYQFDIKSIVSNAIVYSNTFNLNTYITNLLGQSTEPSNYNYLRANSPSFLLYPNDSQISYFFQDLGIAGDRFGSEVCISSDGNTMVSSGAFHSTNAGKIRTYTNESGVWTQLGDDIVGTTTLNMLGYGMALNNSGTRLAASMNDLQGDGTYNLVANIYDMSGNTWIHSYTIVGSNEGSSPQYNKRGLAFNEDGTTLIFGLSGIYSPDLSDTSNGTKYVNFGGFSVYDLIDGVWTQFGNLIRPEYPDPKNYLMEGALFGGRLSMSSDGNKVVVSSSKHYDSTTQTVYDNSSIRTYVRNTDSGYFEEVPDSVIIDGNVTITHNTSVQIIENPIFTSSTSATLDGDAVSGYELSAGTTDSSTEIFHAFDHSTSTNGWMSTTSDKWLQIKYPQPVLLNSYKLQNSTLSVWSYSWILMGSNDGTTFTTLDTQTAISEPISTDQYTDLFYITGNTIPYQYYRIDFSSNSGSVSLGQFRLNTYEIPPLIENPVFTSSILAKDPIGRDLPGYEVSARTVNDTNYEPYLAFEHGTIKSTYASIGRGDYRSATYDGENEWLQIKYPQTVLLYSYQLQQRVNSDTDLWSSSWEIQGSNDGVNFVILDSQSEISTPGQGAYTRIFKIIGNTTYYQYYRLVFTNYDNTDKQVALGQFRLNVQGSYSVTSNNKSFGRNLGMSGNGNVLVSALDSERSSTSEPRDFCAIIYRYNETNSKWDVEKYVMNPSTDNNIDKPLERSSAINDEGNEIVITNYTFPNFFNDVSGISQSLYLKYSDTKSSWDEEILEMDYTLTAFSSNSVHGMDADISNTGTIVHGYGHDNNGVGAVFIFSRDNGIIKSIDTRNDLDQAIDLWISDEYTAKLRYGDINTWDVSHIEDMNALFQDKTSFNSDISNWNTSNVTKMDGMFQRATSFNQNIGGWNISKVFTLHSMFNENTAFNQDIGNWNISNVVEITNLFYISSNFNQDISSWDTSNVTDMTNTFNRATVFNQDIKSWNTSNVMSMLNTFSNATSFNQNIGGWNTSNVTTMQSIFNSVTSFNQDIGGWDTSNVESMRSMLYNCNLFNQNLGSWNVSNVTDMNEMLSNTGLSVENYSGTLIGWYTQTLQPNLTFDATSLLYNLGAQTARNSLTDVSTNNWTINDGGVSYQFSNETDLQTAVDLWISNEGSASSTYGTINNWDVSLIEDMSSLFQDKSSFNSNISNWNTSNVTTMVDMFHGANSFNQNIGGWNVSNVTDMNRMFRTTNSDASADQPNQFNQNIGGWNVSKVVSMDGILSTSLFDQDIGKWNVSNVTDMKAMFNRTPFNHNIEEWDVSKVKRMDVMFDHTENFNQNIGSWNVSQVTAMGAMFRSSIFNQDIGGWDVSNLESNLHMFRSSSFNQNLGGWSISKLTNMSRAFDDSAMSVENYSSTLIGWSTQTVQSSVNATNQINIYYNDAGALARDYLIDNFTWNLTGDTLIDSSPVVLYSKYSDTIENTGSATGITHTTNAVYSGGDIHFTSDTLAITNPFTSLDQEMTISFWFEGISMLGSNYKCGLFYMTSSTGIINIQLDKSGTTEIFKTWMTQNRSSPTLEDEIEFSLYVNGVKADNVFASGDNNGGYRTHPNISLPFSTIDGKGVLNEPNYHFAFTFNYKSDLSDFSDIKFGTAYHDTSLIGDTNWLRTMPEGKITDLKIFNKELSEKECLYLYEQGRRNSKIFSRNVTATTFNGSGGSSNSTAGSLLSSDTDLFTSDEEKTALSSILGNESKTIEAYVSVGNTGKQYIATLGTVAMNQLFGLYVNNLQLGFVGINNDHLDTGIYLSIGESYRVAISYSLSSPTTVTVLCQNLRTGIEETSSDTISSLNTTGNELVIGSLGHGNHYWNGNIREVNVYNIAISSFDDLNSNYPPSAMTANATTIAGYGKFEVSASSVTLFSGIPRNDSQYIHAFDYTLNTVSGNAGWGSDEFYDSNGIYYGSENIGDCSGEWISLRMHIPVKINAVSIAPREGHTQRAPRSFVILGSNDGTNWDIIYESPDIPQTEYSDLTFTTFEFHSIVAYQHFAMVITQIFENTDDSDHFVNLAELRFHNIPVPMPLTTEYPTVNLTSSSQDGYTVSASSHFSSASHHEVFAFNGEYNNSNRRWRSANTYESQGIVTESAYEGSALLQASASPGEYLIITMPKSIRLKYIVVNSSQLQTPRYVEIYGKNSGETIWTYITNYTYVVDNALSSSNYTAAHPIDATEYYSEYAFVVVTTNGFGATSIYELEFHGYEI